MLLQELEKKKLISPPSWLTDNCQYLTIAGSNSYGTADTNVNSDFDLYGFCIPKKEMLFEHLAGDVPGFGRQKKRFEQFLANHVFDPDALGGSGREYDITCYNIVKYFNLLMDNNPACIDTLFTSQECILHITKVGHMIRDNRKLFLHKGLKHRYLGYAFSMLHKMTTKNPKGKRKELREKHGFDSKFAMNVVRLLGEAEMLLAEGDLDLRRNCEHLKAIRRGEVSETEIRKWASEKELYLEKLYNESNLPHSPNEEKIKQLLLNCLEQHYGSLDKCIVNPNKYQNALLKIKEIIEENQV